MDKGTRAAPGCLLLVVGPSGSGKDTLLRAARALLGSQSKAGIVFPRRFITREPDAHEDHHPLTEGEFSRLENSGAFMLSWRAHGLSYGISSSVQCDLRAGSIVVCNVSRTVVAGVRQTFANVSAIEITAPPEVLQSRLVGRGRESEADRIRRLDRQIDASGLIDLRISNTGTVAEGAAALLAAIRQLSCADRRREETLRKCPSRS